MSYYVVYGFSSFFFLMSMPGNPRDISFSCVKWCHSTFSQVFARERRQAETQSVHVEVHCCYGTLTEAVTEGPVVAKEHQTSENQDARRSLTYFCSC